MQSSLILSRSNLFLRLVIQPLFLGLAACGGKDLAQIALNARSLQAPGPGPSQQCTLLGQRTGAFVRPAFRDGKVVLNRSGQAEVIAGPRSKAAGVLSKGHELVALLRRHCESQSEGALYKELRMRARTRGYDRGLSPEFSVGFSLPTDRSIAELSEQLIEEPCIVGVSERIRASRLMVPNDPRFREQKHHNAIASTLAWDTFFAEGSGISKTVVIAIIDDGISLNHEDIKDNVWVNKGEIAGNGKDDDGNGYVDDMNGYNFADGLPTPEHRGAGASAHDHGSHVAGLSAAHMGNGKGVAGVMGQKVKILGVNVFGMSNGAATEDIDAGIRYAADMGANVINMSLGGVGESETTLSALQYAASKGAIIAAAAGNDNRSLDTTFFAPAGYAPNVPGMIAVASTDSQTKQRSFFSNYSKNYVEIAAPGSNGILSTVPTQSYRNEQGTSMASPIVAGAMGLAYGLIWSRTGVQPTPGKVKSLLLSTADKISALQNHVASGNHLNLERLAQRIHQEFPPGSAAVVPGCP